jgi:hypothetical protein
MRSRPAIGWRPESEIVSSKDRLTYSGCHGQWVACSRYSKVVTAETDTGTGKNAFVIFSQELKSAWGDVPNKVDYGAFETNFGIWRKLNVHVKSYQVTLPSMLPNYSIATLLERW